MNSMIMLLCKVSSRVIPGRRFIFLPVLSVLFLLSNYAKAQKLLTLEEAIATALQHNYDIILSKNDSAVAALDYSYRNAVFLPRLNANVGATWNKNNQKQDFANGLIRNAGADQSGYFGFPLRKLVNDTVTSKPFFATHFIPFLCIFFDFPFQPFIVG